MLAHLQIKNYALIRELEMDPHAALNMVTGETGAGKSIMLGAMGLLLGNRADTTVLLNDHDKCIIEGEFGIGEYKLKIFFEQEDLDYSDTCIIRREISPSGKSRGFINDTPVTLDTMKRLGSFLMDIHSQHDTLQLANNLFQLQVIDAFASTHEQLDDFQDQYAGYLKCRKTYHDLLNEAESLRKEADYNHFLFEELEKANLRSGEQEELEDEGAVLENAGEIKSRFNQLLEIMGRSEFAVDQSLQDAARILKDLAGMSGTYKGLSERIESVLIEVRDLIGEVENAEDTIEMDPQKLEEIQGRLSLIYQLQQKHNTQGVEDLLQIRDELSEKVSKTVNLEDDLEKARSDYEAAEKEVLKLAEQLSKSRARVFDRFGKEIQKLLSDLGMPNATLQINAEKTDPGPMGIDKIHFRFSANKGVEPEELRKVASGGEFTRLMFSIKYLIAGKTALPTIIFDEIDSGVSGEIARKLGKMMKTMSTNHQVITISHLPQIAAKGDQHYFVFKDESSEQTVSKVRLLSDEERIEEIAKMIGGDNPSKTAFQNARELIAH